MTEFRVEMSYEARTNLADIHAWIAESAPAGADRWLEAFEVAVFRLERFPLSFGLAPESEFCPKELRQILFKTRKGRVYRAVYFVDGDTVKITHVRGPRQRLIPPEEFDFEK